MASPQISARRKRLAVDMPKLVAELQRQPKFEHRLRRTSKLHPRDFPPRSLLTGAVHELEHTDDPLIAVEIAMDHLAERKDYYRRLHRAIPNAGANKSDVAIPKEWADELVAWGEFSPAAGSVGEQAKRGEKVDPVRARLAVEELRELSRTMKDKRLGRMAHVLRGKLENRVFEHELGIAEENAGPKKKGKTVICTPCGPMECPKKGGRCKPLARATGNPSGDTMRVPKKVGAALVGFMARECNFDFTQSTLTKVADASVAGRPVDVDELDEAAAELREMAKAGFKRAGPLAEDLEDLLVDHIVDTETGTEPLELRGGKSNGGRRR